MASNGMREHRHARTASLTINGDNGRAPGGGASQRFDGPRSPPNTSHVPCKFFRQGACQAGPACPFSHDIGAAAENVCKYFAKGNCKFGPKCANIHVLPNGKRINYGKNGITIGSTPVALTGRANGAVPVPYHSPTTSALTTGLYRNENNASFPYGQDDRHHVLGRQPSLENGLPLDSTYSHPGSQYGSPRDEDTAARYGLALSPINAKGGLSVMDAPLPASFDSNGISHAARYPGGPWPASVPSKFGLDSPSSSVSAAKESRTSETLKLLHTSAFGSSEHLVPTPSAGSPPGGGAYAVNGDDYPERRRPMHSSRYTKQRMLSSSVPKTVDHDWEPEFAFLEEDCVPQNLQDLLTPAEKARRGSVRAADGPDGGPDGTKYGSPAVAMAASPSRWPPYQRQKDDDELARPKYTPSAFGHVGSPLRTSSLAHEMGSDVNGSSSGRPSAAGMRSGSDSMSALTQQLQRTRLSEDGSSPHLHPSRAMGTVGREKAIERHLSSGSIGSRFTTPIDEEDPAFVFNMEEEEEQHQITKLRKRGSSGPGVGAAASWSYAGIVAGKGSNVAPNGKDQRGQPLTAEGVRGR